MPEPRLAAAPAPPEADAAEAVLHRWALATGELVEMGLNSLPPDQGQLLAEVIARGGQIAVAATLNPLCVRGLLELPGGEPVVLFEVHGAESGALH